MKLENYNIYLGKTADSYSNKVKKYLVKKFLDKGIVSKKGDISGQLDIDGSECIDIANYKLVDQIRLCLRKEEGKKLFENWEFEKDYKYSVLFEADDFESLWNNFGEITPLEELENNFIAETLSEPVAYQTDNYRYLKFNLKFAATNTYSDDEYLLKYPFIIVLHKNEKVVEFRFDVIKKIYLPERGGDKIYKDLIEKAEIYLKENYSCNLKAVDLDFLININQKDESVKLIAQSMKTPNGGNAQLNVGNNQEYVIPVIGELKALLADHQGELEKSPELKEALEQFLYEMEDMSDYPWIELLWENEIKTRSNQVKFIFNYMGQDYCLLQYYYSNLIGMERMNDVVKYIMCHRKDDKTTE